MKIISLNVGRPRLVLWNGQSVSTGIYKTPVEGRVMLRTLQEMSRLEPETIVPGHGDVLRGDYARAYLRQVTDFIQTVTTQVSREIYRIGNGPQNLEAVREAVLKSLDLAAWRQKFAGDDPDNRDFFDTFSLRGLVTAAYAEAWGR